MKERPIIMTGHSVQAILEERKTQTRRVMKPQPPATHRQWGNHGDDGLVFFTDHPTQGEKGNVLHYRCPYGSVGDRLWVREIFRLGTAPNDEPGQGIAIYADFSTKFHPDMPETRTDWCRGYKTVPSIHMPRWASRITLEVTGVKVERVQDISEQDVLAEGCETGNEYWFSEFQKLWDSINGKRGYPWESDPWVWCVSFKRVEE